MARGTQLIELRRMLRAEAGQSVLVSAGVDNIPSLDQKLRRTQEMLYNDYDWPFLTVKPYKTLNMDQRYYDIPAELDLEGISEVALWVNGRPQDVSRGIGFEQYAQYDSDSGETASPVQCWDIVSTGATTAEQIEVWPIPSDDGQRLQFIGIRTLNALVNDSDRAVLDDLAIVLTCAAELLAGQEAENAGIVAKSASHRIAQMKGRVKNVSADMNFLPGRSNKRMRGQTVIRVGG